MSTKPIYHGHGSRLDESLQRHHEAYAALAREDSRFEEPSDLNVSSESHPESRSGYSNAEHVQDVFEMEDLSKSVKHGQRSGAASSCGFDDEGSEKESFQLDQRDRDLIDPSFMPYTPDEERSVIKAFDRRLVLFIALLYMLSFLDRSNTGNAKIAGLSEDLDLSSSQYEWLLRAFYITYILFEWMTLLYRVVPPHIYIATCVASWGLVASLQSIAPSFAALLVLRALLGVSEAAFGPGVPFYLSFFYKRDELAFRTGLFISAAPLATSFASSLAWAITKAGESIPIAPWRMLFLVEGFPSVIVAVFAWLHLPDRPGTARYLSRRLRQVARIRLRNETSVADVRERETGLKWGDVWNTLKDPKCYLTAAMFFCCNVAFSSLPVFLPTIIEEMGYSASTAQALSTPPYLVAFMTVLLTAYLSDRHRTRGLFVIFHSLLAASGYALIAIAGWQRASTAWRYAGIFPSTIGFFSAITIIITWTINNQDSDSKKGTGVAMLNVIGQLGPLVGVHLYPDTDGPYYVRGMSICAAFMAAVAVLAVVLSILLGAQNRTASRTYTAVQNEYEGLVEETEDITKAKPFVFML